MATEETKEIKMEVEEANDSLETPTEQTASEEIKPEDIKSEENNAKENGDSPKSTDKPKNGDKPETATEAKPHYRVKISGLPRFYKPTDPLLGGFKNLLKRTLGLDFKYIRSPKKGNSWLYVTFYNQADQEKALKALKHYTWKGRTLICTLVVADVLKRKQEDSGPEASKRPRLDIPIEEQMLMSTIPYYSVSYNEQLSKKNEEAQCLLKWLAECMEKKTPQLIGYIDQEIAKNPRTRLPFKLDEVRSSPLIDGYRNKCEFRIGLHPQTKKVIVGYRVDNQEGDNIAVAPPDSLRHLPKEMLEVVKVFEKFVQESPHPPQIQNHDTGVWRLLHVRINKAKQLMVVVLINPTVLSPESLVQLKTDLIKYFTEGPAGSFNVVSLYLHTDNDVKTLGGGDKVKRPTGQLELLWGQTHMEEQLLDLNLEIDPNFYFQNNTFGAEELYKAVMELAGVDEETTVLDLCCGSGGMGMMFAKRCKEVIGVEVMDVNVDDAKRLAAKNGLTNCEFLQGSVDDLMPELEEKLKGKKVVPILDPPRVGISNKAIASIRKSKEISRLIYISSNHKPPVKNLLDFANVDANSPFEGLDPFVVKRVLPLDTSPHTLRCELVFMCERLATSDIPKPNRLTLTSSKKISVKKISSQLKKHYYDSNANQGGRSNYFPTEEMVRRYSNTRKPQQEIDYQKRDSLYPPPLRGALYQGHEEDRPYYPPAKDVYPERYSTRHESNYSSRAVPVSDNRDLARYNSFRRDMEDALNETSYYTPGKQLTSRKLAYANALLEEGIRIASEVLDDGYTRRPSSSGYYSRQRNPRTGNKYRY
ncbi:tRNA (uracil(54)-C(5))-methyltransferase homolog isoform X2 [Homalodisca vitripennis]|uniref:tRNA (uracil(54)-C(5))-methyltransferase homolog isoform X2 n=1 Tax=Homalodisca vitripennis TaxID=197043 RepID=UPI001EEBC7FD|nr:tRNA (uracil(54)-C(5))-methyltransferase homolog isoform X2 [Homalodisca vitripennis]